MQNSSHQKTILFVDDEIRVLNSLAASFEDDYHVIVESNPKNALRILSQKKVHVLVSDQRMPEMLGYQLLAHARKIQPNTVRLLMTGYSDKQSILETINKGEVFRFIAKPWSISELSNTLEHAAIASEARHIELNDSSIDLQNPLQAWHYSTADLDYNPSLLLCTKNDQIETLFRVTSEQIEANVYIHKSVTSSIEAILENKEISIIFFEMNSLNAEIISALAMLRRIRPNVVSIILTQSTDFKIAIKLINHGQAFRYLTAPLSIIELRTTLFSALQRHMALTNNKEAAARYESDTRNLSITQRVVNLFARIGSRNHHSNFQH